MNKWTPISLVVAGIVFGLFHEHSRGSAGSSSAEYAWSVARECVSYLAAYYVLSQRKSTAKLICVTLLGTFIAILLVHVEIIIRFQEIVVSDGLVLNASRVFSIDRVVSVVMFVPVFGSFVWVLTFLTQSAIGFVYGVFQRTASSQR